MIYDREMSKSYLRGNKQCIEIRTKRPIPPHPIRLKQQQHHAVKAMTIKNNLHKRNRIFRDIISVIGTFIYLFLFYYYFLLLHLNKRIFTLD